MNQKARKALGGLRDRILNYFLVKADASPPTIREAVNTLNGTLRMEYLGAAIKSAPPSCETNAEAASRILTAIGDLGWKVIPARINISDAKLTETGKGGDTSLKNCRFLVSAINEVLDGSPSFDGKSTDATSTDTTSTG